jgi:xanthine dehydrogenase small subunit
LDQFFLGYKQIDLRHGERIEKLTVPQLPPASRFNFEKVSKRRHLDIASVNSALLIEEHAGTIKTANISAGGVGPVPLFLKGTSDWLSGQPLSGETVSTAMKLAGEEVSPISDVRGTADYKRRLLQRLVAAHFMECFPDNSWKEVLNALP